MLRCAKKNKLSVHQIYETSHVDGPFVNVLDYYFRNPHGYPLNIVRVRSEGGRGLSWRKCHRHG